MPQHAVLMPKANLCANANRDTRALNAIDVIMDFMDNLTRIVYHVIVIRLVAWAINVIRIQDNVTVFKESLVGIVHNANQDKYLSKVVDVKIAITLV